MTRPDRIALLARMAASIAGGMCNRPTLVEHIEAGRTPAGDEYYYPDPDHVADYAANVALLILEQVECMVPPTPRPAPTSIPGPGVPR